MLGRHRNVSETGARAVAATLAQNARVPRAPRGGPGECYKSVSVHC